MDGDFLNIYIDTLIRNVHDLTSKNIVLDTKLQFGEKQAAALSEEITRLQQELDTTKTTHANDIERLTSAIDRSKKDLDEAVHKMNNLASELGACKRDAENLRAENMRAQVALEESESERIRLYNELQLLCPPPVEEEPKEVEAKPRKKQTEQ